MNFHYVDLNKQEKTYLPFGSTAYFIANQYLDIYRQVTSDRVGTYEDLQPEAQFGAQYVGSVNCENCHQEIFDKQEASMHTRMIQVVKLDPFVVVGNFATWPGDADFELANVVYTIGGKLKQRYMLLNWKLPVEYGEWKLAIL